MLRKIILVAVVSLFVGNLFAKENTTAFLENGVGAKALGMGNSYTGSWLDGNSFYWNPAGISFAKRREVSGMYATSFLETSYNHFGYTHKLPKDAAFGINWIRYSIDKIPVYNTLTNEATRDPNNLYGDFIEGKNFDNIQQAYYFTFGKKHKLNFDLGWLYYNLPIEFGYGFNVKVIRMSTSGLSGIGIYDAGQKRDGSSLPAIEYDDLSVTGIGMDLGFLFKASMSEVASKEGLGDLGVGFQIQDLSEEELKWSANTKDKVERAYLTGVYYVQDFDWIIDEYTFAYNYDSRNEGSHHFGGEVRLKKMFAIRLGSNDGDATYGLGFIFKGFTLDWAYWNHSKLDGPHRFNLSFQF